MNIEINCTNINLGLLFLFLFNLDLIHGYFNTVLRLVVCSVLFSYIKQSKAGDCVQSQLTNLSRTKEPRADSLWKHQILKAWSVSYLLPSSWVLQCVFCGKLFLKAFYSGNLTCAQETRWLRFAWWRRIWTQGNRVVKIAWQNGIFLPSDSLLIAREWCLELSNWMSVFKMFTFTTQHLVIEFPERTSDCEDGIKIPVSHYFPLTIPTSQANKNRKSRPRSLSKFPLPAPFCSSRLEYDHQKIAKSSIPPNLFWTP